jgi:predicted MFS family arabinose efflux permease
MSRTVPAVVEPDAAAPDSGGAGRWRFEETFRALRNRNYQLYWLGQLVSQTGTWMQRLAQSWLVLQLTGSPLALGTVSALQFTPTLLLALFGGVVADRIPKRRLLVMTQSILALQAAVLAALTTSGQIQLWHVYLLATVLGLASAFDHPGRQSFVMEMVGPKDLRNAIALNSSLVNVTRLAGPAVAGALIERSGLGTTFWLNAASYLAVIWALLAMREHELFDVPTPARGRVLAQIREGVAYSIRSREICWLLILLFVMGSFGHNMNLYLPLLARFVLDVGPFELGVLYTAIGVGSVLTSLGVASHSATTERAVLLGTVAYGVVLALSALSSWLVVTALLLAVLGGANIVFSAIANTRMQLASPPELRGRIMSLQTVLWQGMTPFGSLVVGGIGERFGVRMSIIAAAAVCLLGALAALVYARVYGSRGSGIRD